MISLKNGVGKGEVVAAFAAWAKGGEEAGSKAVADSLAVVAGPAKKGADGSGGGTMAKVHLHTDDPAAAFALGETLSAGGGRLATPAAPF